MCQSAGPSLNIKVGVKGVQPGLERQVVQDFFHQQYSDTPSKKFVALGAVLPKPPQKTSCPQIAGAVWVVAGKTNPWELMGAREMISNR